MHSGLLQIFGIDDPRNLPLHSWINNLNEWPSLHLGQRCHYLPMKKEYALNCVGSTKGSKALLSISKVTLMAVYTKVTYDRNSSIKCSLSPSQKIK